MKSFLVLLAVFFTVAAEAAITPVIGIYDVTSTVLVKKDFHSVEYRIPLTPKQQEHITQLGNSGYECAEVQIWGRLQIVCEKHLTSSIEDYPQSKEILAEQYFEYRVVFGKPTRSKLMAKGQTQNGEYYEKWSVKQKVQVRYNDPYALESDKGQFEIVEYLKIEGRPAQIFFVKRGGYGHWFSFEGNVLYRRQGVLWTPGIDSPERHSFEFWLPMKRQ